MTMTLIETKTLPSAAASIEFTSIPQTFTDLVVLCSTRTDRAALGASLYIGLNGLTTGFSNRSLFGNGSVASSFSEARLIGAAGGNTSTANTFASTTIYIPNYTAAVNKSISSDSVSENNGTVADQGIVAVLFSNTAAITSVQVSSGNAPNLITGSTISLYGILKGSDGIVTTS